MNQPLLRASHLLVSDRDEALLGEFPQRADVRPHVQFTAHQHHFGVGAELLSLALPLWTQDKQTKKTRETLSSSSIYWLFLIMGKEGGLESPGWLSHL